MLTDAEVIKQRTFRLESERLECFALQRRLCVTKHYMIDGVSVGILPRTDATRRVDFQLTFHLLLPGLLQLPCAEERSRPLRPELGGDSTGDECAQKYKPHQRSDPGIGPRRC